MYNDEYDNEQDTGANNNFLTNFYYNNKVLIWIFIGIIAFIIIMSLLTGSGSSSPKNSGYNVTILPETTAEVSIGNSIALAAKVNNVSNPRIVWTSSDENIAKVSNGTVKGINYGKAVITATYIHSSNQQYTATKDVVVADGDPNLTLTNVSFENGDLLMAPNSTYSISLVLTPSRGYVTNKEFTSSNERVVRVDNNGVVQALSEGEAIITVNINNNIAFRKTLRVYVSRDYTRPEIVVNPEKISFDSELRKMKVGMSELLKYYVFPEDVSTERFTWSSSDETVVKVDQKGIATALKEGNAIVTLKSANGITSTIHIEVETDIVDVTDINLSLSNLYLKVGQSQTITPIVSPDNASNKALNFVSGDTSIITVSPNSTGTAATIYALRNGTTTVTVSSSNNVERRLNVTVTGGSDSGNSGSSGGSSGGSGSSTSSQGFTIASNDANGEQFINTTYERTKPINNGAVAPVTITLQITDSSIAKLRVAVCTYPATSCDPSKSANVHEINGSGSFVMYNTGEYVLRVGKYNNNGTLVGTVDKFIWIKSTNGSGSNTTTGSYKVISVVDGKELATSETTATYYRTKPTQVKFQVTGSDNYINVCWAYKQECSGSTLKVSSTTGVKYTETLSKEGLYIFNIWEKGSTKSQKRYIYIENSGSNSSGNYGSNTNSETGSTCVAPTNVRISETGIVVWNSSATATSYQISFNNSSWTTATNGGNYLSNITSSLGQRTVYVRSVCGSLTSTATSKSVNVYRVNLTKGTGISAVYGYGNYIEGRSLTINADVQSGYSFKWWTSTDSTSYTSFNKSTTITVSKNLNLKAEAESGSSGSTKTLPSTHSCNKGELTIIDGTTNLSWKNYCTREYKSSANYDRYYYTCNGNGNYTGYRTFTCNLA